MSFTATTSISPRSSARRTNVRPMRPNPLIPTRMVMLLPIYGTYVCQLADDGDRTCRVVHYLRARRAHQQACEPAAAPRPDDDQVGVPGGGDELSGRQAAYRT